MRETVIELQSTLAVDPSAAWRHATSLAGIGSELPWPLRLTTAPPVESLEQFVAARSVRGTLRFGPIPILRWHPGIVELGESHFVEASTDMTGVRSWRHERRISVAPDGGSILLDRVTLQSHVPGAPALVRLLFRLRHRALRRALSAPD